MKHLRVTRIFALSVGLAVSLAIVGHALSSKDQDRGETQRADELERVAKHRFENFRGLSPCEGDAWQLLRAARGKLIAIGESDANLIVVIAPTFSEIELVAFGPDYIRTYRFPGQTGFTPPSGDWFSPTPLKVSDTPLTASEQFTVVTPLVRHVRYAMTAREYGLDGISYYFGSGDDDCAFAWGPRRSGSIGLITDMITETTGQAPSTEKLLAIARAINRADSAR